MAQYLTNNLYELNIMTDGDPGCQIEVVDVPNRPNIEIHVGNFTSDMEGFLVWHKLRNDLVV